MNFVQGYYQKAKEFHSKFEKFLIPTFLALGFLFDYMSFGAFKASVGFTFLGVYWVVSSLIIIFISFCDAGWLPERFKYVRVAAFLLLQLLFGNLLSGILVFYWFSAAFSISWPFIAVMLFLMLFNDVFREFFSRPHVQLGLFFLITFLLLGVMLPFAFNSISAWLFVVAAAGSVIIFSAYAWLLFKIRPLSLRQKAMIFAFMGIVVVVMSTLYYLNIIPPVPLVIREAGVYHSLKVSGASYLLGQESQSWWQKALPGRILHVAAGERLYVYTAIYAPKDLNTTIIHEWQYYDEKQKDWVEKLDSSFNIFGGRQNGYKGYSWLVNPPAGHWRVYVKNQRGQVLGKMNFTVESVPQSVLLEQVTK